MSAEIPHWVEGSTWLPSYPQSRNAVRLNANGMAHWLQEAGAAFGWREVTADMAVMAARQGAPAVAVQSNPSGSGHMAVILPESGAEVRTAQAGAKNWRRGPLAFDPGPVLFFAHA